MKKKGLLITFEGPEGSGKTTQIKKTVSFLRKKGYSPLVLREPGGTTVSEAIREVILNKKFTKMTDATELLLYLAARAQIVGEKIKPALQAGKVVVCDRFEDSTLAYQGYGRGLSLKGIQAISELVVREKLKPHLTFLLDIDPKKGMGRGGRHDRMERQSLVFHQKVRRGFLDLAKKEPRRIKVIDGTQTITDVTAEIQGYLKRVF